MDESIKTCPRCAESVKAAAAVCRFCGYNFVSGKFPEPSGRSDANSIPEPRVDKQGLKVALIIIAILLLVSWIANSPEDSSPVSADEHTTLAAAEPLQVTVEELHKAYDANEVAAQQQYGGRPLAVTGTVESISLGPTDEPFLTFQSDALFPPVQAQFTQAGGAASASLSKGQQVTLHCLEVSELMGTPMLGKCEIKPEYSAGDDS